MKLTTERASLSLKTKLQITNNLQCKRKSTSYSVQRIWAIQDHQLDQQRKNLVDDCQKGNAEVEETRWCRFQRNTLSWEFLKQN